MGAPRLSMTVIARNHREHVDRCFGSWWDAVDEVVMVDTGGRDGTVAAAREFAARRGEPDKLKIGRFKWCDDFSAAHNHADSLATGDLLVTIDMDETMIGAENLRGIAEQHPELSAWSVGREESDRDGFAALRASVRVPVRGTQDRVTMIRAGSGRWVGALHNHWSGMPGPVGVIPPYVCSLVHHRPVSELPATYRRYVRVARKAAERDPDDAHAVGVYAQAMLEAVALRFSKDRERAVEVAQQFFDMPGWRTAPVDVLFIVSRLVAELGKLDRRDEARRYVRIALRASMIPTGPATVRAG